MVADGLNFVLSGGHHVNSMGYYVTEIPFEENQWVEAIIGEWNIDDNDDDLDWKPYIPKGLQTNRSKIGFTTQNFPLEFPAGCS